MDSKNSELKTLFLNNSFFNLDNNNSGSWESGRKKPIINPTRKWNLQSSAGTLCHMLDPRSLILGLTCDIYMCCELQKTKWNSRKNFTCLFLIQKYRYEGKRPFSVSKSYENGFQNGIFLFSLTTEIIHSSYKTIHSPSLSWNWLL